MDVSVIIVNYNTRQMTVDCIESVKAKTEGIKYEIILVDNASTDGSKEYFEKREDITYIYSEENLGFGRANNLGAEVAKGKYLFLLNSDTLLINNAIKILFDYMSTHPKAGVVGGNLYTLEKQPTISFERSFHGIYLSFNLLLKNIPNKLRFGRNRIFNYTKRPLDVAYISGADLMIEKQLFNSLKGFSPEFFMYYEETDLCKRVRKDAQKGIVSVPQAKIIHLEGGSLKKNKISARKAKMILESRFKFIARYHNKLYQAIDLCIYKFYLVLLAMIHPDDLQLKESKHTTKSIRNK